jgi:Asp-tRNA(Asn)/Glu-tRNA(Gln) amidotransferase A subunit family amidase
MSELCYKPAYELAALVRAGTLSPVDLVRSALERIDTVDRDINAFVALRPEEALADAARQADRLARGEEVGALAGLPLGVKDLEDAVGLPNTHGSLPFKDHRPRRDSIQVERLKAAGAIVLGKTNAPEFGYTALTKNLVYGVTRNPWNLERTPGGSSGGSAAAIAAGLVPLATGSDGGGSVRIPACFVGAFGFKPTFGMIPDGPYEMQPWIDTVCQGPITRTVRDAALYLDAVVGAHPLDPTSLPHPGYSFADRLEEPPRRRRALFNRTLGYARVEPDVMRQVESAVAALAEAGYEISERDDVFPDVALDWAILSGNENYAQIAPHVEAHRKEFGRSFLAGAERVREVSADRLGVAYRRRAELNQAIERCFAEADILLTPTLPIEAFAARGPFPDVVDGQPISSPLAAIAFTYPFNMSGHPAASVRAGLTDAGLPCGLQIVGPRHRDDWVLQAARAYERVRPWNDTWPLT